MRSNLADEIVVPQIVCRHGAARIEARDVQIAGALRSPTKHRTRKLVTAPVTDPVERDAWVHALWLRTRHDPSRSARQRRERPDSRPGERRQREAIAARKIAERFVRATAKLTPKVRPDRMIHFIPPGCAPRRVRRRACARLPLAHVR